MRSAVSDPSADSLPADSYPASTLAADSHPAGTLAGSTLPADPRLVVTDMDGTLLDADGRIPDAWWPLLAELRQRGIMFAVASGRQFATLSELFAQDPGGVIFIAENGAYVVQDGVELSSSPLHRHHAERIVTAVRAMRPDHNVGLVWCGREAAYIERQDAPFVREAAKYYANLELVDDLLAVRESPLKYAVFDFDGMTGGTVPLLAAASDPYRVVVSSERWMDIMDLDVHKGVAVRALRSRLGVAAHQTIIFGDYLNDLEMLDEASYSYAMANAHPEVISRARFLAPSNRDHGVVATLTQLIAGLPLAS